MKSSTTASVEPSATAVTPTSTLGEHRLRQPTERNYHNERKNDSK